MPCQKRKKNQHSLQGGSLEAKRLTSFSWLDVWSFGSLDLPHCFQTHSWNLSRNKSIIVFAPQLLWANPLGFPRVSFDQKRSLIGVCGFNEFSVRLTRSEGTQSGGQEYNWLESEFGIALSARQQARGRQVDVPTLFITSHSFHLTQVPTERQIRGNWSQL